MVEAIKQWFIRWKYYKELNRVGLNKSQRPEKIRSVAIILDGKLKIDEKVFIEFASRLRLSKRKINILVYADKEPDDLKSKLKKDYVWYDDITLFGKMDAKVNSFLKQDHDLLVNYFDRSNMILKLLSLKCRGRFRLGFGKVDHRLNDLILDFKASQTEAFLKESIKYLRIIFNS